MVAALTLAFLAPAAAGARPRTQASPSPSPSPSPDATATNATFGIGPANTGPNKRPYFNYVVQAGAQASDDVSVVNVGLIPVTLAIYPTDIVGAPDGSSTAPPASVAARDAGAWIDLGVPGNVVTLTVAPRSNATLPIKFSIPASATPGDHVGGIIASLKGVASNGKGQLIQLDQRVATRAFFRVAGPLVPKLSVENLHAVYQQNFTGPKGKVVVSYTLSNRGNVKLSVKQQVSFKGLFGSALMVPPPADLADLLPGSSASESMTFSGVLPEILGTVKVTATPGAVGQDADQGLHPITVSRRVWTLPLLLILILVILVLLIVAWRYVRRKYGNGSHSVQGPPQPPRRLAGDEEPSRSPTLPA